MTSNKLFSFSIEEAAKIQNRWFWIYIALLILVAIITFFYTRATNRYQELIKQDADIRIAEAGNIAVKANERAAELEKKNLELSLALEVEKVKRLTLEKSLEPRIIPTNIANNIIQTLAPFRGQKVQLVYFIASPEAINFANQIKKILLAAGWMVFASPLQRTTGEIPTGVLISGLNPQRPSFLALERAFSPAIPDLKNRSPNFGGLLPFAEFRGESGSTAKASELSPEDIIDVWIGLKSQPTISE